MNSQTSFFKFLIGYCLSVFPLFLLIGPLISEIILILSIIFSFYYIVTLNKSYFYLNRFSIFFIIFCLSTLVSTLINFYNFDYTKSGLFYFRLPLFALSIWFILQNCNLFNKKVVVFYILLFTIIITDSLIQFTTGENLIGYNIVKSRISSFFGDELILGGFLTRALPIFLIFLIMSGFLNEKKNTIYFSLFFSIAIVVTYLSGERTSFFLVILFFSTLFFSIKYLRKFIIIMMISFVGLAFLLPKFSANEKLNPATRMFSKSYAQIIGKGEEQYEEYKQKIFKKVYIFSHDHHGHYMLSFKIFKDHIFLGTGPKGFRYLCRNKIYILEKDDGCSTHPHNTYVQILTSNGIVGFSLLLFAFIYIIKEIFRCKKKIINQKEFDKDLISESIIVSAIFINLWPLIPSGNFFNNWLSMIYFYPIGFYLYFKHKNEKEIN